MTSGAAKASEEFGQNTITRCSHCIIESSSYLFIITRCTGSSLLLTPVTKKGSKNVPQCSRICSTIHRLKLIFFCSILMMGSEGWFGRIFRWKENQSCFFATRLMWTKPRYWFNISLMQSAMNSDFKSSKVAVMPLMQSDHWSLMSSYQNLLIVTVMPLMQSD